MVGGAGLHDDDAHGVGDHIVKLPGNAQSLFDHRSPGSLLRLFSGVGAPPTHAVTDQPHRGLNQPAEGATEDVVVLTACARWDQPEDDGRRPSRLPPERRTSSLTDRRYPRLSGSGISLGVEMGSRHQSHGALSPGL